MKKIKKRISSLLIIVMVLSMGSSAFAAGSTNIDEISTDINMIDEGYLEVDVEGNVCITQKYKDFVIDSNSSNPNLTVTFTENSAIVTDNNPSTRSNTGVTKIEWTSPLTFYLYLDNEVSKNVSDTSWVAAVISGFFPPPLNYVLATALTISAVLVDRNNAGRGVVVSGLILITPVGPSVNFYWIKSQ